MASDHDTLGRIIRDHRKEQLDRDGIIDYGDAEDVYQDQDGEWSGDSDGSVGGYSSGIRRAQGDRARVRDRDGEDAYLPAEGEEQWIGSNSEWIVAAGRNWIDVIYKREDERPGLHFFWTGTAWGAVGIDDRCGRCGRCVRRGTD